jgi:ParB family chromosome partitioning protein
LHVASDPGLALDIMVFTLADADTHDWRARPSTTLRAPVPAGPIIGFEAKDAPASSALAELRSGLDESWRAGDDATSRFDLFRALPDDSRAAWLGYVVARSLEASLNMSGERQLPFQDHLGSLIGIDMAQWWRPTAANYFDRVSKQVILDALTVVGGLELSSRFAAVKKGDLAMSAERIFAGTYITEVEVREKAVLQPVVDGLMGHAQRAGELEHATGGVDRLADGGDAFMSGELGCCDVVHDRVSPSIRAWRVAEGLIVRPPTRTVRSIRRSAVRSLASSAR